MFRRLSNLYAFYSAVLFALFCIMLVHAADRRAAAQPSLLEKREMVKALELTDLCVFTEARYTRHLAMADFHSAFQDGPMSFEHFPSGSLFIPVSKSRQ